ncbi:hypothetical protein BS47DRAFT_1366371 [Hydnum rufescens UP504]|uniref:Uncharacterized protein n=1 Tax=Hydnum rufescens UP504 TaxID=1448309 RepID=A0A9P6AL16_9AGAM|nr:hypothetical protein BS47DRAFT_1366371 [Hydnum rufescens UP504]
MDNASSNGTMANALTPIVENKYNVRFDPANGQIRCMAHAINHIAQKILLGINEADDPDIEDYYLNNAHLPVPYSIKNDALVLEHESKENQINADTYNDDELKESKFQFEDIASPIKKVLIVNKIPGVSLVACNCDKDLFYPRMTCFKVCHESGHLMVVRDMRVRWNSTHGMVKRGWVLKKEWGGTRGWRRFRFQWISPVRGTETIPPRLTG